MKEKGRKRRETELEEQEGRKKGWKIRSYEKKGKRSMKENMIIKEEKEERKKNEEKEGREDKGRRRRKANEVRAKRICKYSLEVIKKEIRKPEEHKEEKKEEEK
jgi:hypothetical protein